MRILVGADRLGRERRATLARAMWPARARAKFCFAQQRALPISVVVYPAVVDDVLAHERAASFRRRASPFIALVLGCTARRQQRRPGPRAGASVTSDASVPERRTSASPDAREAEDDQRSNRTTAAAFDVDERRQRGLWLEAGDRRFYAKSSPLSIRRSARPVTRCRRSTTRRSRC